MRTPRSIIFIFFFMIALQVVRAQTDTTFKGTLEEQLNILVDRAFPYDTFKDIRPALPQLQKNVLDSIQYYKRLKNQEQATLIRQSATIDSLHLAVIQKNDALQEAIANRDNFSFLGISVGKLGYNMVVWGLIVILALLLLFFINRYKSNISIARESKTDLENLKEEYETHRKKAMEREQKLKRDLQDELNKSTR